MYYDYFWLLIPVIIFTVWAQSNVSGTFNKYSKIRNVSGMTGYDAARCVLENAGVYDVRIERVAGSLTDHYDPRTNTIRLSESVYDSPTQAAVGVAAHEAGHALQYATGYSPMKLRAAVIPMTNIGSNLAMPLVLLGLVLSFPLLAYLGVILFSFAVLFQLITLPVEYNASNRAVQALEACGRLSRDDITGARKTLSAAALTYVAALASALVNLLRLLSIARRSDRK